MAVLNSEDDERAMRESCQGDGTRFKFIGRTFRAVRRDARVIATAHGTGQGDQGGRPALIG